MRNVFVAAALCAVVGIVAFAGQTPAPQTPAPSADPYANNAVPGATQVVCGPRPEHARADDRDVRRRSRLGGTKHGR